MSAQTWQLRRTQLGTIVRLELGKTLFTWRASWIFLVALVPAGIIGVHALRPGDHPLENDTEVLAGIFQYYYLRIGIFFGCLGVFTRLFRGEMMEKSAHYYLLAPVRRELLVVGKFCAGALTAALTFGAGVLASFLLMYSHYGRGWAAFIFEGPGLGHLGAYLAVTLLACLGYGALFLLIGLLVKNPVLPAISVLLWESINHVLPAALKPLSVIFYLEPMLPVEAPVEGITALFAIPADPIPTYLAVPGLLVVAAAILTFACWRVRATEINYSAD